MSDTSAANSPKPLSLREFRKRRKPLRNVNKAAATELETQLEITLQEAGAIVRYRRDKGNFKTIADLRSVPGLDMTKIEPIQQRLVF